MTHLLPSTKISSWLEAIDPGFAELRACCKDAESATLTFFNAFHSNTLSPARCDELATTANDILARIDVAKRRPLPPTDVLFRTCAEATHGDVPPLPPPDAPASADGNQLSFPSPKAARKPRQSPPDGLKTPTQAAAKLGCSIKTLDGHVASGALRYVIIGHGKKRRRIRFTDADLNEFIINQARKDVPCPSIRTRARRTGNLTSGGEVIAFTGVPKPGPGGKQRR